MTFASFLGFSVKRMKNGLVLLSKVCVKPFGKGMGIELFTVAVASLDPAKD